MPAQIKPCTWLDIIYWQPLYMRKKLFSGFNRLLLLHTLTVPLNNNNLFICQKSPPGICWSWFDGSTITGWNPWCLSFWLIVPHSPITPACRKREGQNFHFWPIKSHTLPIMLHPISCHKQIHSNKIPMQIIINRHSTTGNVYPSGVNMQESIDSPPSYSTYSGGDSLACTVCITIIIL